MDRIKTLLKYVLWVILLYIISNILIWGLLKVSYKKIDNYEIDVPVAKITIEDAKTTSRNGYINGKINNINNQEINNEYIKIDLYSKRDVLLGTRYLKIEKMLPYEIYEFQVNFKIGDIHHFNMCMTDSMPTDDKDLIDCVIESIKSQNLVTNEIEYPSN